MQPSPPTPPPPPSAAGAPALPDPADPTVVATPGGAVTGGAVVRALPRTAQDVAGLREHRRELSRQLESAQNRRKDVASALERARDPVNQNGLQARLRVLDARIAQLESDISETGRLLTSASPSIVVVPRDPRDWPRDTDRGPPKGAIAIVFILFVLFPLVLALTRGLRRRGTVTRPDPVQRESVERLARLEQAVDAIAVEVERVSEGQRFVTRLLAETRGVQALASSQPQDTLDAVPRYGANG